MPRAEAGMVATVSAATVLFVPDPLEFLSPRAEAGMMTVSLRPYHKGLSLGSPFEFALEGEKTRRTVSFM